MAELYHELPAGCFRLLEFLRISIEGHLKFQLHTRRLRDGLSHDHHNEKIPLAEEYTAISHAWSHSNERNPITVNDRHIDVNTDLWECLQRISKNEPLMWIDSLCINQSDLDERGRQVTMMGFIYQDAKIVSAWLASPKPALNIDEDSKGPRRLFNKDLMEVICSRKYWLRTWIIQEVLLSRDLRFYIGHNCIHPDHLCTALALYTGVWMVSPSASIQQEISQQLGLKYMNRQSRTFDKWPSVRLMLGRKLLSRTEINSMTKVDLFSLLRINQNSLCTDPRDKIFALLGLISREERQQLWDNYGLPDYHLSTDHIMCRVLSHLISRMSVEPAFPLMEPNLIKLQEDGGIQLCTQRKVQPFSNKESGADVTVYINVRPCGSMHRRVAGIGDSGKFLCNKCKAFSLRFFLKSVGKTQVGLQEGFPRQAREFEITSDLYCCGTFGGLEISSEEDVKQTICQVRQFRFLEDLEEDLSSRMNS